MRKKAAEIHFTKDKITEKTPKKVISMQFVFRVSSHHYYVTITAATTVERNVTTVFVVWPMHQ
jgi:hypothetical protein